jgi:hypothetical protein
VVVEALEDLVEEASVVVAPEVSGSTDIVVMRRLLTLFSRLLCCFTELKA